MAVVLVVLVVEVVVVILEPHQVALAILHLHLRHKETMAAVEHLLHIDAAAVEVVQAEMVLMLTEQMVEMAELEHLAQLAVLL
jgi:hypothetical protein